MSRVPGTYSRPRKLYMLPEIRDDATPAFKNALAIRNAASVRGVCPACGARGELTGPDRHGFMHITFRHEPDCQALLDDEAA